MVYYTPGSEAAKRQQERWVGEYEKGVLLLGFAKGTTEAEARRIVESRGGTLDKWFGAVGGGAITINNPSGNIEEDIKKFSAGPSVRYAERSGRVYPMGGAIGHQQQQPQQPQQREDIPGFNRPANADPSLPDFLFGTYAGGLTQAQAENQQRAHKYMRDNNLNQADIPGINLFTRGSVQAPGAGVDLESRETQPQQPATQPMVLDPEPQQPQKPEHGIDEERWNSTKWNQYWNEVSLPEGWTPESEGRKYVHPDRSNTWNKQRRNESRDEYINRVIGGNYQNSYNKWLREEQYNKLGEMQRDAYRKEKGVAVPQPQPQPSPEPEIGLPDGGQPAPKPVTPPAQPPEPEPGPEPWKRGDITPTEQKFKDETGLDPEDHANGDAYRQWIRAEKQQPIKSWDDLTPEEQAQRRDEKAGASQGQTPAPGPQPQQPLPQQPDNPSEEYKRQESLRFQNSQRLKGWQGDLERLENLRKVPESSRLAAGGQSDEQLTMQMLQLRGQIQNTQAFLDKMPASSVDPAPAPTPSQQQPPAGMTQDQWRAMDPSLAYGQDFGGWQHPDGQQSMMDLWGGGGQQAPTRQWGGQQGWQRQQQGQSFQDPITGRMLDRQTGQPVDSGGPPGTVRYSDLPDYIKNSPQMRAANPTDRSYVNVDQIMSRAVPEGVYGLPGGTYGGGQGGGGQYGGGQVSNAPVYQDPGGWQGGDPMEGMPGWGFGIEFPPWATLPDSGFPEQIYPADPAEPMPGYGDPGQNIPGAGVIPGLPPVSPIPGAAPQLGQYGQEIAQAANAKLQQAPQSAVPSGSPVVYPSSQVIAPTTRQGGGGRRGGGGASPFAYGVRIQ